MVIRQRQRTLELAFMVIFKGRRTSTAYLPGGNAAITSSSMRAPGVDS
jgi:hypothetical protein